MLFGIQIIHFEHFTVPHFVRSSMNYSFDSITPKDTTLPIEQHVIFYDCVKVLELDEDRYELPYCYNYVQKLILNNVVFNHENVLDLSKVKSFVVKTSEWPFEKLVKLIKKSMPSVNYLSLHCTYTKMNYQNISLEQIRTLCLPQYGESYSNGRFNWSRVFPLIERLIATINSKSQIEFLIHQFKNINSGFFTLDTCYFDKKIKITRQWLEKQLQHSDFICQIEDRYAFLLSLWIGENNQVKH